MQHTFAGIGKNTVSLTVTGSTGSETATIDIRTYWRGAGYFTGTIHSDFTGKETPIELIVGANQSIYAYDVENRRTSFWGDLAIVGNAAAGQLNTEIWESSFVFPNGGRLGAIDLSADLSEPRKLTASYRGMSDIGNVDVSYVPEIAERPSSLGDVSGTWRQDDVTGLSSTLTIAANGNMHYRDSDGCTARGRLSVIEPSLNGFAFRFDWYCPGSTEIRWNGPSEGIAFVDEIHHPGTQWLVFAESAWNGASDVWSMRRSGNATGANARGQAIAENRAIRPDRVGRRHHYDL